MKKYYAFIPAAALLMLAACNKEASVQVPEADGQTIQLTLNATMGADETKTTMSYNDNYGSLQSVWAKGDKVYVYSKSSGNQLGILTIDDSSITNEGGGSTSYAPTSKASFKGSVELGGSDTIKDDFAFIYQGSGRALAVADGLLTYPMGCSETVAGLSEWDVAYATGKIQGDAADASCAVSFANKMGFGYFTTAGVAANQKAQYYESFTLDVKTGAIAGVAGEVTLPDQKAFYMPLVPGTVNISCGRTWTNDTYVEVYQGTTFNASAGVYYRLGRNAEPSFGPVAFVNGVSTTYNTMKDKTFAVSETKNVYFTPGNLQYIASKEGKEHWQLAPTQYSYLGSSNAKPATADAGTKIPRGDYDLFGWGEVTYPFFGSNQNSDYQSSITDADVNLSTDWATKFNSSEKLYQDYNQAEPKEYSKQGGVYCVLTKDEWTYLFTNQYWGYATVTLPNDSKVYGLVVLPSSINDDAAATAIIPLWRKGVTNAKHNNGTDARFDDNKIASSAIDAAGALFLPAAGYRGGTSVGRMSASDAGGYYWSTTSSSATNAYYVLFNGSYFYSAYSYDRFFGRSVRLASVAQ